jgi:antitoxin VapB
MALSIKDEETDRLARVVAQKNGETVTMAVKVALRERLQRQEESGKRKSRLKALQEFAELCAPLFKDGRTGNEMINDLYDEQTGLPK